MNEELKILYHKIAIHEETIRKFWEEYDEIQKQLEANRQRRARWSQRLSELKARVEYLEKGAN